MQTFVNKNFKNLSVKKIKKKIEEQYKFFDIYNFKKCLIYGASNEAKLFINECIKEKISVEGIIDDFKQGYFEGYKISNSLNLKKNVPIIICTHRFGRVVEKMNKLRIKNFIPAAVLQILRPKKFNPHKFYNNWISEFNQNIKKYLNFENLFKENESRKPWRNYMMFKYTFNSKYLNSLIIRKQKVFSYTFPPEKLNLNISGNEIFVDGGGWIGDSALCFSKKFKKNFIYEPHVKYCRHLKKRFNNADIIVKNCGLGNKNRSSDFYDSGDALAYF